MSRRSTAVYKVSGTQTTLPSNIHDSCGQHLNASNVIHRTQYKVPYISSESTLRIYSPLPKISIQATRQKTSRPSVTARYLDCSPMKTKSFENINHQFIVLLPSTGCHGDVKLKTLPVNPRYPLLPRAAVVLGSRERCRLHRLCRVQHGCLAFVLLPLTTHFPISSTNCRFDDGRHVSRRLIK